MTIDEAARYLNVSKTSLRRWTNDGRLDCVRIGVRRERRFRRADLDRFIADSHTGGDGLTPSAPGPSAGADGPPADASGEPIRALELAVRHGVPRHVSLHFSTLDEHWRLFRPYFLHHVQQGAPILYIHDPDNGENMRQRIRSEGYDPDALAERGLLKLLTPDEAYLRTGSFAPGRMIDFMEAAILDMRASGHELGMLSGEMTWYLSGAEGVEGMIPYEMRLNDLLARYPDITIVCHYDVQRLDSSITLGALCSHPHVQLPDRLVPGYWTG